jgi:hypothetical protein
MEEIDRNIQAALEGRRKESEEIKRSIHEDLVKRAPEILRQQANELLPAITKTLRRALSYAGEADYARDHIRIPEGDLAFWHYYDLGESLEDIDSWREYLSREALEEIRQHVNGHAETALRILKEYRAWGTQHEAYTETQRNAFGCLWTLHTLAPAAFPRNLVQLTDQEFEEIGTDQMFSSMNSTRRLIFHAKLVEYDPKRFRAIFGNEYTSEELDRRRQVYKRRDWQEPLKVPMWSSLLNAIEDCMAASETDQGPTH